MKKYSIVDDEINNILGYFVNNGYIDFITISEIESVLRYINSFGLNYKKKCFLLVTDDYNVITIINSIRKTCYIYSNCGINFNINQYVNDLSKYYNKFSAIACNNNIYQRIKLYLDERKILIEKNKLLYSFQKNEFEQNKIENSNSSILLNQLCFSILSNIFCKIIDNEHLFFINQHFAGIVTVDNTIEFIEQFYQIELSESIYEIDENTHLNGKELSKKEDILIYDLDLKIQSIVIIKNANPAYEIIFADTINENFSIILEMLADILNINKQHLFFADSNNINLKSLSALGFINTNEKVYFYYSKTKHKGSIEDLDFNRLFKKVDYKSKIIVTLSILLSLTFFSYFVFLYF